MSGAPGIPPAVAVCLLSSTTSSAQPHVAHSASTHGPGKPQLATPHPLPIRLQSTFSLTFSVLWFCAFPVACHHAGLCSSCGCFYLSTDRYHISEFHTLRVRLLDEERSRNMREGNATLQSIKGRRRRKPT